MKGERKNGFLKNEMFETKEDRVAKGGLVTKAKPSMACSPLSSLYSLLAYNPDPPDPQTAISPDLQPIYRSKNATKYSPPVAVRMPARN